MNYHGYKNSGIRYALFLKKLHYHSSICLQVVARGSLYQPKETEEGAYMKNCEKKLINQLDIGSFMKPPREQSSGN